jgi:hypothetical protein
MSTCFAGILTSLLLTAAPVPESPDSTMTREYARGIKEDVRARLVAIVSEYRERGNKANPFQTQVCDACKRLLDDRPFPDRFPAPKKEEADEFKKRLQQIQMNAALVQFQLDTALEELDALQGDRAKQAKTWQVSYDYVRAHLAARIGRVYEYNAQLGAMRKEFVPALDPMLHSGWQLTAGETFADRDAAKYIQLARKHLEELAKDQPPTSDWVRIASDEIPFIQTGLKWMPLPR